MHPNRTKRRLRRLLLSWEKLGTYVSSPGAHQELTTAAETAFLRTKIRVARSVGYLKLIEGTGDLGREAARRETEFIELLEKFPSLHSAMSADETARRELYHKWHSLYLFLHKLLGANPYETGHETAAAMFGRRYGRAAFPQTETKRGRRQNDH
jgi:hypothetical protein